MEPVTSLEPLPAAHFPNRLRKTLIGPNNKRPIRNRLRKYRVYIYIYICLYDISWDGPWSSGFSFRRRSFFRIWASKLNIPTIASSEGFRIAKWYVYDICRYIHHMIYTIVTMYMHKYLYTPYNIFKMLWSSGTIKFRIMDLWLKKTIRHCEEANAPNPAGNLGRW